MENVINALKQQISKKEKIVQLCDQIKDLLKNNDREYIVANVPISDYPLPEYYKTIIGELGEDLLKKLNDAHSAESTLGDIYIDDEETYEDEDEPSVCFFGLIAIRIKNDELVFCIEDSESESYDGCFETIDVHEMNDLSLYDDDGVIRGLEAYVRILSDKTKYSILWEI